MALNPLNPKVKEARQFEVIKYSDLLNVDATKNAHPWSPSSCGQQG